MSSKNSFNSSDCFICYTNGFNCGDDDKLNRLKFIHHKLVCVLTFGNLHNKVVV